MAKRRKRLSKEEVSKSSEEVDKACSCAEQEDIDLNIIQKILDESLAGSSNGADKDNGKELIVILQKAQDAYGYIPRAVIDAVNKRTGIATSKIYGVVTFYDQFSTEKRGKYVIKTCSGTACQVRGGKKSLEKVKKKLGVDVGETTPDYQFTVETAGCLGACAISPAMLINKQLYGRATEEKIDPILAQYSDK